MAFVPKLGLHVWQRAHGKGLRDSESTTVPVQGRESGNGENTVEFKVAGPRP